MVTDVSISFGKRIELARRRRGLSRELLGDLIGRSSEWIRQVERDERPVDRLSVLLLLARTLKIANIGAFLGSACPPQVSPLGGDSWAPTASLRDVLYGQRFPAPDGDRLGPELEALWTAWESSPKPYSRVLQGLPGLIGALGKGAEEISARAHRLASIVLRRLGDLPPALLAAERAVTAAHESGDLAAQALCAGTFAEALVALGSPARARRLCSTALAGLSDRPEANTQLHLIAAAAAVADDDPVAAEHHLDAARSLAQGHGRIEVEAETARIALAQGRHRQALSLAQTVDAQHLRARERRARHYLTVAAAHARDKDCPATVVSLLKAEDACPEETRFNPEARHLVQDLMRRDNALVRHDVWALAERTGLA